MRVRFLFFIYASFTCLFFLLPKSNTYAQEVNLMVEPATFPEGAKEFTITADPLEKNKKYRIRFTSIEGGTKGDLYYDSPSDGNNNLLIKQEESIREFLFKALINPSRPRRINVKLYERKFSILPDKLVGETEYSVTEASTTFGDCQNLCSAPGQFCQSCANKRGVCKKDEGILNTYHCPYSQVPWILDQSKNVCSTACPEITEVSLFDNGICKNIEVYTLVNGNKSASIFPDSDIYFEFDADANFQTENLSLQLNTYGTQQGRWFFESVPLLRNRSYMKNIQIALIKPGQHKVTILYRNQPVCSIEFNINNKDSLTDGEEFNYKKAFDQCELKVATNFASTKDLFYLDVDINHAPVIGLASLDKSLYPIPYLVRVHKSGESTRYFGDSGTNVSPSNILVKPIYLTKTIEPNFGNRKLEIKEFFLNSDTNAKYTVTLFGKAPGSSTKFSETACKGVSFSLDENGQIINQTEINTTMQIPDLEPFCDRMVGIKNGNINSIPDTNPQKANLVEYYGKCKSCLFDSSGNPRPNYIWTAVGCMPTSMPELMARFIFPVGLGFGGGIAFLYFIYGAFMILTSAGSAERVAQAREIIISSLSGLLLIIFSVLILRIVGVDILNLPGFS